MLFLHYFKSDFCLTKYSNTAYYLASNFYKIVSSINHHQEMQIQISTKQLLNH